MFFLVVDSSCSDFTCFLINFVLVPVLEFLKRFLPIFSPLVELLLILGFGVAFFIGLGYKDKRWFVVVLILAALTLVIGFNPPNIAEIIQPVDGQKFSPPQQNKNTELKIEFLIYNPKKHLWIVGDSHEGATKDAARWYPQNSLDNKEYCSKIPGELTMTCQLYIGTPSDKEDTDTVYLFLADDNANEKLKKHLDKATNPNSNIPMKLPDGLTVIDKIEIVYTGFE